MHLGLLNKPRCISFYNYLLKINGKLYSIYVVKKGDFNNEEFYHEKEKKY